MRVARGQQVQLPRLLTTKVIREACGSDIARMEEFLKEYWDEDPDADVEVTGILTECGTEFAFEGPTSLETLLGLSNAIILRTQ